jgi:hypothetical protein
MAAQVDAGALARPAAGAWAGFPLMTDGAPYAALTPEAILDAVDACGRRAAGRVLARSRYENRGYQVWVE